MKSLKMLVLAGGVALTIIGSATAGTTFVWAGGSGRWSEASNWKVGGVAATRAPGCDANIADDIADIDPAENVTIEIDQDITLYKIGNSSWHTDRAEPYPELTLTGGHTVTMTSTINGASDRPRFLPGLAVHYGNVTIDTRFLDVSGVATFGPGTSLVIRNTLYLFAGGARATFEEGCQGQVNSFSAYADNSAFVFNGGTFTGLDGGTGSLAASIAGSSITVNGGYLKVRPSAVAGTTFRLLGGEIDDSEGIAPGFHADSTFEFKGGTLRTQHDIPDLRYLGGKGTVLDCLSGNSTAVDLFKNEEQTVDFGGTLYLTNASGAAHWHFGTNTTVTGRGKVYGGSVFLDNKITAKWDLDTLALGGQLYQGTSATTVFGDDLNLGAFGGNWSVYDNTSTVELGGKIKVDTLDCRDQTTPRTISLIKASPRPGTSLEVTGGGTFVWNQNEVVRPIGDVVVRSGSTLRLLSPLSAASLTVEANAAVEIAADNAKVNVNRPPCIEALSFTIDPAATISYKLPAAPALASYPLVSRPDGGDVASIAARISFDANGNTGYQVHVADSTAFVWNGVNPTRTFTPGNNQYLWTGESSADDKWGTAANWYNSSVPGNSANYVCYFGGMVRTTLYGQTYSSYLTSAWRFLPTCGPMTISSGDPVRTTVWSDGSSPNFTSWSRFPIVFKNGLVSGTTKISLASSNSYMTVLGPVTPKDGTGLYVKGDIRFGGTVSTTSELNFFAGMSGGRETRVEILPGGTMTVGGNTALYTTRASIVVDAGGTLTYSAGEGNVYGWNLQSWVDDRVHVVNGTMNVMCPISGVRRQRYRGTGTLHLETTRSCSTGDCEINVGGGLRVTSGGFQTVTTDASGHAIRLFVENEATLGAERPWTYGPASGVATTTTVEDRALYIKDGATLTIDTPAHAITFEDPIRGKGTLRFAAGAKIVLGANLPKPRGQWTEIATVGAVEGEPVIAGGYREFSKRVNDDGTVTFLVNPNKGTVFILR